MDKAKLLSANTIKTKTVSGEICHITSFVFDNGITVIRKRILSTDKDNPHRKKIYTKFGKSIFEDVVGFKYDTLIHLALFSQKTIIENKVNPANIIR